MCGENAKWAPEKLTKEATEEHVGAEGLCELQLLL